MLNFLEMKVAGGYDTKITLSMINFPMNHESIRLEEEFWSSAQGLDNFIVKPFTTWDGSAADVNSLAIEESVVVAKTGDIVCDWPWKHMTVTWNGDVVPCCVDYDNRYILGNVEQETLTEIWNGERMRTLRREFMQDEVTNPLCGNCEALRCKNA